MGDTFTHSKSSIWEEIERSETYLVSSMFEEAATLSSSVLKRIIKIRSENDAAGGEEAEIELHDMMESAGMVLVQALHQIGGSSGILNELKVLFVSTAAIPVQVLVTGACFQIQEGSFIGVREFLEEFLSKWSYKGEHYYLLVGTEMTDAASDVQQGCVGRCVLEVEKYMEVVEVLAVTLLATASKDFEFAISWVEKAALPEEQRQVLLRRLQSLYSLKATTPPQGSSSFLTAKPESQFSSTKQLNVSERSSETLKANYSPSGDHGTKQEVLKLSRHAETCFWLFRSVNLKFGNSRVAITNWKILLGCLIFLGYYYLRRKQTALNGFASRQLVSIKKALLDLWQLAFSYQVNPLAAVQPLSTASRGGH